MGSRPVDSGSSGGSAAGPSRRLVRSARQRLGGSIRYPASNCGCSAQAARARNPIGPEYGDAISGWAVEQRCHPVGPRQRAVLDAISGRCWRPLHRARAVVAQFSTRRYRPGRLRIGFTSVTGNGQPGHSDCVVGLDKTVALLAELGHESSRRACRRSRPRRVTAIGVVFNSATAWIVGYGSTALGASRSRRARAHQRVRELGKQASAGQYLAPKAVDPVADDPRGALLNTTPMASPSSVVNAGRLVSTIS